MDNLVLMEKTLCEMKEFDSRTSIFGRESKDCLRASQFRSLYCSLNISHTDGANMSQYQIATTSRLHLEGYKRLLRLI